MADLELIITVMGLFLVRIGIPVIVLVSLGVLVDHWQRHRDAAITIRKPTPRQ